MDFYAIWQTNILLISLYHSDTYKKLTNYFTYCQFISLIQFDSINIIYS